VNKEANSAQRATLDLWHERLGHVNRRTIEKMMKEASVEGLTHKPETEKGNGEDIVKCDACVLGKQHRHPIPASGRERAKQVGDAVHVDLWGPIGTEAIDKSFYFVLFKDEFSNFRIVYTVRTKDLVYDSIRKCVAQIESDTKKKVKCLVSDCGSEIVSNRTKEFLMSNQLLRDYQHLSLLNKMV